MHIKNRQLTEGTWKLIQDSEDSRDGSYLLLPLSEWIDAYGEGSLAPSNVGAWIDVNFELMDLPTIPNVLGIHFEQFTDGRGYSLARLVRERFEFQGDLIAIGDILRDQLRDLERCGFNVFVMRPDQDVPESLKAFDEFDVSYQKVSSAYKIVSNPIKIGAD